MEGKNQGHSGRWLNKVIKEVEKQNVLDENIQVFYTVYASKFNKETLDYLMYGMTLSEFFDHKNFIDIQNSFEQAVYKDQEHEAKRNSKKGI